MGMDKLIGNQAIIVTLDIDALLLDKLEKIAKAGLSLVEINGINQELLSRSIKLFPSLRIGVGNVVTTQQLEDAYQAGAHFATSPGFLSEIVQTATIYSMNYLPGVATLSEAMHAMTLGCHYVRPFPADLRFCTLLNKYLPLLRLFPAEIEWEEAEHFLNLPSVAAVSVINPEHKQLETLSSTIFV